MCIKIEKYTHNYTHRIANLYTFCFLKDEYNGKKCINKVKYYPIFFLPEANMFLAELENRQPMSF
jgi:hypothetical protein